MTKSRNDSRIFCWLALACCSSLVSACVSAGVDLSNHSALLSGIAALEPDTSAQVGQVEQIREPKYKNAATLLEEQPSPPAEGKALPITTPGHPDALPPCSDGEVYPIDLPTALSLVNASNPTVAAARYSTAQAYCSLHSAQWMWLPNLQAGPAYGHHDRWVQNTRGNIIASSSSDTSANGGAVMSMDTSEALFRPLIARQQAYSRAASEQSVTNQTQLQAAVAYLELQRAYGGLVINANALDHAEQMLRKVTDFNKAAGITHTAAFHQVLTEVNLRRQERCRLQAQAGRMSAQLAQVLLLPPKLNLQPNDAPIVPITLVPADLSFEELLATAMQNRPELADHRAQALANLRQLRQAQFGPLMPTLAAGYTGGFFGSGNNGTIGILNNRADGVAAAVWQLDNMGVGDYLRIRGLRAQYNQAQQHIVEVQARVATEVMAEARAITANQHALKSSQEAVHQAEEWWQQLQEQARDDLTSESLAKGLQLLLAEQILSQTYTQYLGIVIDYNESQFRLYTAMGQPPLEALPTAVPVAITVPVLPKKAGTPPASAAPRPSAPIDDHGP